MGAMPAIQSPAPATATQAFLARTHQLFIGGRWVNPLAGGSLDVYDPATGGKIATAAAGAVPDVDAAVAAARTAFSGPGAKFTAAERGNVLWKLAELIERDAPLLTELEVLDNGQPLAIAQLVVAHLAPEFFRYYAGWPTKIE